MRQIIIYLTHLLLPQLSYILIYFFNKLIIYNITYSFFCVFFCFILFVLCFTLIFCLFSFFFVCFFKYLKSNSLASTKYLLSVVTGFVSLSNNKLLISSDNTHKIFDLRPYNNSSKEGNLNQLEFINNSVKLTRDKNIPSFPLTIVDEDQTIKNFVLDLFWKNKINISMFDLFLIDNVYRKLKDLAQKTESQDIASIVIPGSLSCLGFSNTIFKYPSKLNNEIFYNSFMSFFFKLVKKQVTNVELLDTPISNEKINKEWNTAESYLQRENDFNRIDHLKACGNCKNYVSIYDDIENTARTITSKCLKFINDNKNHNLPVLGLDRLEAFKNNIGLLSQKNVLTVVKQTKYVEGDSKLERGRSFNVNDFEDNTYSELYEKSLTDSASSNLSSSTTETETDSGKALSDTGSYNQKNHDVVTNGNKRKYAELETSSLKDSKIETREFNNNIIKKQRLNLSESKVINKLAEDIVVDNKGTNFKSFSLAFMLIAIPLGRAYKIFKFLKTVFKVISFFLSIINLYYFILMVLVFIYNYISFFRYYPKQILLFGLNKKNKKFIFFNF